VVADLGGLQRDLHLLPLAVHQLAEDHAFLQIDDTALAERRHRLSGLRVQLDEAVANGEEEDALVAFAVRPVREAAARELARRDLGAPTLIHAVDPSLFTGARIDGHYRAAGAGSGIHHAVDHQGRSFELVLEAGAEVVGLEPPRHFQLVEVRRIDLIERHVPAARDVSVVGRPLTTRLARKPARGCLSRQMSRCVRQRKTCDGSQRQRAHGSSVRSQHGHSFASRACASRGPAGLSSP
jgi:hypothetical protein